MLDEAFRQIAGMVSEAVGGPYHAGVVTAAGSPVYDDGGDIVTPGTPTSIPCRVQRDNATEAMRRDDDFQEIDVRLIVLDVAALTVGQGITITDGPHAGSYRIRSAIRDPLAFAWECRGRAG